MDGGVRGRGTDLPALQEEAPIYSAQPHDGVARLEVSQAVTALMQEQAQAAKQLRGGGLDDGLAGARGRYARRGGGGRG